MIPSGEDVLRLASVDNLRDVAGPGYRTADGATVRRGVFYRSGELRLSDADRERLAPLGLRAVIDLRSAAEVALNPEPQIPQAATFHFDVAGIPMEDVSALQDRQSAVELMNAVYRGFVASDAARAELGCLFRQLAAGGPQLFHCTAGKDRTGWAAALLLHLAGVSDETIEADYLRSNDLAHSSRRRVEELISDALGPAYVEVFEPTLVVDVAYLQAGYAAVSDQYGDRATYLRAGLGLDEATLEDLRRLLREPIADPSG